MPLPAVCKSPRRLSRHIQVPLDLLTATHAQALTALGTGPLLPLPIWPQARDLEDRRDHLRALLNTTHAYLRAVLADAEQNVPCDLDLRQIEALCCDLTSEVAGAIGTAAAALPGGRS